MSQPPATPPLSLTYLARPPQTGGACPPPLLLQLHGIGSNEHDLFSFAGQVDSRFRVLSVRAPLTIGPQSFAWFDVHFLPEGNRLNAEQLRASTDALRQFINEAITVSGADPERVYLIGFSQGAIMALTLALTSPATVAGVVAMSGRIPPEVIPWMAPKEALAGLPILLLHGAQDTVIPLRDARRARETLASLPIALTYQQYDMGHEVTPQSLRLALSWLSARLDEPRRQKGQSQMDRK